MGALSIWHIGFILIVSLVPMAILYWVVRLAVLHALREHDRTKPRTGM